MKTYLTKTLSVLTLLVVFSAASVSAEMVVTTHGGKELKLPISSSDVKKIEFTAPDSEPIAESLPRYLGCFKDFIDNAIRDLDGYTFESNSMTIGLCTSTCADKGFKYAATQYSRHCFCGNSYGRFGTSTACNMPCSGNSKETCGGGWANSLYKVQGKI